MLVAGMKTRRHLMDIPTSTHILDDPLHTLCARHRHVGGYTENTAAYMGHGPRMVFVISVLVSVLI